MTQEQEEQPLPDLTEEELVKLGEDLGTLCEPLMEEYEGKVRISAIIHRAAANGPMAIVRMRRKGETDPNAAGISSADTAVMLLKSALASIFVSRRCQHGAYGAIQEIIKAFLLAEREFLLSGAMKPDEADLDTAQEEVN